jgi:hypothetical protein
VATSQWIHGLKIRIAGILYFPVYTCWSNNPIFRKPFPKKCKVLWGDIKDAELLPQISISCHNSTDMVKKVDYFENLNFGELVDASDQP